MKALFLLSSGGCGKQASISPSPACPRFISLFILRLQGGERRVGGALFGFSSRTYLPDSGDSAHWHKTGLKGGKTMRALLAGSVRGTAPRSPPPPPPTPTPPHPLNWPAISATLLKGELLITVFWSVLWPDSPAGGS